MAKAYVPPSPGPVRRTGQGRSATVLADQVASNASNALLPILVAGSSTKAEFGFFAIAWAMSNFIVRVSRNGLGVQLSLAAGDQNRLPKDTGLSLTTALILAPLSSATIVLGGWLGTGQITSVIVALALISPIVLSQDLLRFSGIAQGRQLLVLISDALWLGMSTIALLWRVLAAPAGLDMILVWGGGALVGLVTLMIGLSQHPRRRGWKNWVRSSALPRLQLGTAALVEGAAGPIIAVLVGVIAGPEIVAAIAGGAQLMAPINTAVAFMTIGLLPKAASLAVPAKIRLFRRTSVRVAAAAIVWTAALRLIPDSVGRAALGDTWSIARPLIGAIGVQYAIGVFAIGGTILLASLGKNTHVLAIAAASVTLRVVATAIIATWLGTALGLVLADATILVASAAVSAFVAVGYRNHCEKAAASGHTADTS